ncbi:TetR/AcrR family transcriptional regulator [Brachybacterium sp. UNK5269]|uniref:TetR/AcrR family transcriptional regulator n=1 Tax=Brachybacterium sp. UNK5269 TaxID=3408576 RepID=UPI003BB1EFE7
MTTSQAGLSGHDAPLPAATARRTAAEQEQPAVAVLAPDDPVPAAMSTPSVEESSTDTGRSSRSEEILDGAAEMFAEHGYHGASLRNIADHVGISHPGMLHHFPSKDALLDGVIDRMEAHAQGALDRIDELSADPESLLRGLAEIWHPASHAMQLFATLDTEVVSKDHPGRFRVARLHRVHEHVLEQCFATLEEQGLLREEIDAAFAGRAVLALALNHAAREETVRRMQNATHDDSPLKDLVRLVRSFLTSPGE